MLFSKQLEPLKQSMYIYANNIQQGPSLGLSAITLAASNGNSGTHSTGVIDWTVGPELNNSKRSSTSQLPTSTPLCHPPAHPLLPGAHLSVFVSLCHFFLLPSSLFLPFPVNTSFYSPRPIFAILWNVRAFKVRCFVLGFEDWPLCAGLPSGAACWDLRCWISGVRPASPFCLGQK